MKPGLIKFLLSIATMAVSFQVQAQTPNLPEHEKGMTEVETFQGTLNSEGKLVKLDSNIGYDFNRHFGVFAGVPLYFTGVPNSTTSTNAAASNNGTTGGIGNIHLGMNFRAPSPALNYASTITVGAPTGNRKDGLSTGRASIDWSNYFDRSFDRFTPFFEAGLGNGVPDSRLVTHPFSSLGALGHFEEGAEYELIHHFAVGGSGYHDVPFGDQKVFSKLVHEGQGNGGGPGRSHGGAFENNFLSTGAGIDRENGVNTWVAFEPSKVLRAQIGYSRSVTFDLNSFSFNVGLNVGKMVRAKKNQ